jgi:hypothetical protein
MIDKNNKQAEDLNLDNKKNDGSYEIVKKRYDSMTDIQKKELVSAISWFFLTDNIKKNIRLKIQRDMKLMDIASLIFALLGVLTQIVASYFYIEFVKKEEISKIILIVGGKFSIDVVSNIDSNTVQILRFITSFTTLLLLILIVMHYKTRLNFLIFKQRVDINASLFSTRLIYPMLLELLICVIHSYPYMNGVMVQINSTTSDQMKIDIDLDLIISFLVQ